MIEHPGFENERNGFQNNNQKTEWADKMKIKVESESIEIVLENLNDAKEAIQLILSRSGLFERQKVAKFKDVEVTSFQKYETTAVDYKMIFLELQDFFNKV
jgi:hypothetical protein